MADASVPMTSKGFQFLMEELKRLKSVERPKNIRDIEEARDHGDLSENAEFHAAKERQSLLDFQIREMEDKIARAQVIDVSKLSGDKVLFGATVSLADSDTGDKVVYKIVGDHEAEPKNGKISVSSPIARALIGKSEGDEVQVRTPTGVRRFDILGVEFIDLDRRWRWGGPVWKGTMPFSAAQAAPNRISPRCSTAWLSLLLFFHERILRGAWSSAAPAIFVLLCLALMAVPAGAEIAIDARVGFHGVFQLGRPFPLEVELSNSGRPAEGTIDVQVWKGGATKGGTPYPVKYRREVFLAAQSRKTLQFTVDPDFISRPLTISFSSASVNAAREIDLRRNFSPAPVLLLVNDSGSLPPIALGPTAQSRLVALSLSELAADARALLGVSHVILYDQSLRDLSRPQLLALDTWLSAGGRMVIIGSLNYALYQEPVIGRFLPVRVSGTRRIAFTPAHGKDEKVVTIADVWAQVSAPLKGQVLAQSQGVPVLVEAARGRGKIIYLSLDIGRPPLSQWPGLAKYLQTLLAAGAVEEPVARAEWNDTIFTQLITSPTFISTYVPYGSLFLVIVVYLLAIGLLSWVWQRGRLATMQAMISLALVGDGG